MRWTIGAALALWVVGTAVAAAPKATPPRKLPPPPPEPVASVVVVADTGLELAASEPDKPWPPASMTKMMTVLLALEDVRDGRHTLAEPVHVSARAARTGGSQVFLAEGEIFPLGDLLAAAMIPSANDAAVAIAEHLAGSVEAFVERMNARARALGLASTIFHSPNGLPPPPGQQPDMTTAHDLARLARELMRFPDAMRLAGTTEARLRNGTFVIHNTNHLLGSFPGATGLKTGHTWAAGFSLTASATRGDLSLVAVVLGLPSRPASFATAARLLDEAYARHRVLLAATGGAPVAAVAVDGGTEASVTAVARDDLRLVVPVNDVVVETRLPRRVPAPVTRRQRLGKVIVRWGAERFGSVPLVAEGEVASVGWLAWLTSWARSGRAVAGQR
jgi:D-alanyl-D-alanine carboxypeptidase (penicillin-binding protein 5/6)